jgi:putative SOS response-associated peptidase YedK
MPVILRPEVEAAWVSRVDAVALFAPYPAELMMARRASPLVNSVRNDGPEVLTMPVAA